MKVQREKKIVLCGDALGTGLNAAELGERATRRAAGRRIFLLSPANAAGTRAQRLLKAESQSELAVRLRGGGMALGELFSFMSSLYFRGKLAYAQRFANPPDGLPGVLVITPSRGLLRPDQRMTIEDLEAMAAGEVDHEDQGYRGPLQRDARTLLEGLGDGEVVLLGSIATPKYVQPLSEVFGSRLVFPAEFVGRGDMSRGGLLLKCTRESRELEYVPILGARLSLAKVGIKKSGEKR